MESVAKASLTVFLHEIGNLQQQKNDLLLLIFSQYLHFFLQDLNREVVQTNTATVSIPKLQFESPPNKGGKNIKKTLSKVRINLGECKNFFNQRTTNFTFLNDFLVVKFGKQSYI